MSENLSQEIIGLKDYVSYLESKVEQLESANRTSAIYHHFFNESKDLMCIADVNAYFRIINPAFSQVLGYTEEELLSRPFTDFIHPDDKKFTDNEVEIIKGGQSTAQFENRYLAKDGRIVHLQWMSTSLPESGLIYAIARDISEKKITEQKLNRSKELLLAAQRMVKMGNWTFDVTSNAVNWSEELFDIFEIDPHTNKLFEEYLSRFNESDFQVYSKCIKEALEKGKSYEFQHTVNLPGGRKKWVHCYGIPEKNNEGKVVKIEGVVQDVTETYLANEKLIESEKMLNTAQTIAKLGSWSFDIRTHETVWSKELYNLFEIDPSVKEELYESYLQRLLPQDRVRLQELLQKAVENRETYTIEHILQFNDGREKYVLGIGTPVSDDRGIVYRIEGVAQDITDRYLAQKELIRSEKLLNEAQSISKIGSWSMDFSSGELYWSNEMYKIYQIDPNTPTEELSRAFYATFTDEERAQLETLVKMALELGEAYSSDREVHFSDGTRKWIRGTGVPVYNEIGKVYKLEGTAQDITEQKDTELAILNSVREKETLLKELHHRVKNNLQVISSILSLQSQFIDDLHMRAIFTDCRQRIKSMASLHDLLYKASSLSAINFSEYARNMIEDLIGSYRSIEQEVELKLDTTPITLTLDQAVPLGLFMNEVVTNSMKYAGMDGKKIVIGVTIHEQNNRILVELTDNGPGFSEEISEMSDTLGLMLIDNLATQLDGELTRNSGSEGTMYALSFQRLVIQ